MKKLLALFSLVVLLPACSKPLENKAWDPAVKSALNTLIREESGQDAYAVFDFDKTSIVHDISNALMVYQIENLCFGDAPKHDFLDGIEAPDTPMEGTDLTFAEMGALLRDEYLTLKAQKEGGASMEAIHASPVYLDFRARMWAFLEAMDTTFGEWVSYCWMPGLLTGMTEEDARQVVRAAIQQEYGLEKLKVEEWTSPDGQTRVTVERGIWMSDAMKELYQALIRKGITPYVCSASLELIVEELACDPVLGPGLPREQVFGLRFLPEEPLQARFDPSYPQPIGTGKVECIKTFMAPAHGNSAPVLVGGDSNGDVPMLTAFPETRKGLIIDVGRKPETPVGQLAAQARSENNQGRFLLQPAFAKADGAVEGGGI